jgi:L-ascorbate metabolism protein UlaG (beta-lactamase superfamily)
MLLLLIVVIAVIVIFFGIGFLLSGPKYAGDASDHFNGKRFINPGNAEAKGLKDVFKWLFTRKRTKWGAFSNETYGEKPIARIESRNRITFINHSTFLIQLKGLNILTDPIWSERASPFGWSGPKRMRPPGVKLDDLPHIDAILLSHNHYDHLDISTLKKFSKQYNPKIYTSLGVGKFLKNHGIIAITEMDWWQEQMLNNETEIVAVPAQHFSGRGMFDRDATLWAGFVIRMKEGNIYFAADTGYNDDTFKEIGEKCSPITLSIIPIGAYEPRWFMSPIHCSPDEAVKIHRDVKSTFSVGSHFGTFPLADEGREQPVIDLKKAMDTMNIPPHEFIVLKEGTYTEF